MSIQRQRRRGTAAENAAFTGALGEFIYITDGKRLALHDGTTAGGTLVPSNRDLINDYFGYATATGTDTIALTVLAQITAYAAGQQFSFKAANTITGSATLNVNSLGAKTIKKKNPAGPSIDVLEAADIIAGGIYTVRYDGTDMQLISSDSGGGGAWEELATETASGSATLEFESLMTSAHDVYMFLLKDIRPATDVSKLYMRTSTNNGSSYDAAAANYIGVSEWCLIASATTTRTLGGHSLTYFPVSIENTTSEQVGNAAAEGLSGQILMFNPLGTARKKSVFIETEFENSSGAKHTQKFIGYRDATADIDAVQFLFDSGNITSGSISLLGRKV